MPPKILKSLTIVTLLCLASAGRAMTPEERESYRHMLLLTLPDVPEFDEWIQKSNELPPDFDALPRHNALPDPLTFYSGKPVKTAADWTGGTNGAGSRREEILQLYQKYVWGSIPPHPKFDHADVQEAPPAAGQNFRTRTVVLHVGPDAKGTMRVTLQIPQGEGIKGPFPVVMGPSLIGGRGGPGRGRPGAGPPGTAAATAGTAPAIPAGPPATRGGRDPAATANTIRAHGYIVASFSASDGNDDSTTIAALYPDNDPGALPRRGWAASTVVDYLQTLPEVDAKHIAITGYSRDGKSMTIGGALDQRIAAVIAGSPGVGGILPFRLAGERNQAESLQSTTLMFPDWFNPRLRYFVGREDRLPVDGNLLLAAIAPRPFFLVAGLNDEVSNDWGDEQSFHSAQKVYDLLGAKDKLGILRVPGNHGANDWEQAMTWLDIQFGRSDKKWTNDWMFPWNFDQWKTGESIDITKLPEHRGSDLLAGVNTSAAWEAKVPDIRKNIDWLLGDPTPIPPNSAGTRPAHPAVQDVPAWVIGRSVGPEAIQEFGWYAEDNNKTATRSVEFNGIKGTLYYPKNAPAGAKLPTVIWLHSYSYPLGYMWVYHRELHPILGLVDNGYAVLAYDQTGFGSRMIEASQPHLSQTPHWSQMGHMVADARAALDALAKDPALDPKKIYLFGYAMGGTVALNTAALEPRVAGVVSICGFTPMRTDTADKGAGGVARFAIDRPLVPRLGFFIGNESKIPVDYDEIIASISPRPVYIVNPLYDRDATFSDVHNAVESARKIYALYKADDKLKLDEPWDYNRLSATTQDHILIWMQDNMK